MSENLREPTIRAVHAIEGAREEPTVEEYADAVLAVVAPELDRLRAEVKSLRLAKGPALFDEMLSAMGERAERAEAECAVLRERLAKVEALLSLREEQGVVDEDGFTVVRASDVRAVLAPRVRDVCAALASAPEPSEHEQVCGSCGEPAVHVITLDGKPMPVCLRHLNHCRTPSKPAADGGAGGQQTAGER